MVRLGLCCIFHAEPIKFSQTTAKAVSSLDEPARLARLSSIAQENVSALEDALVYCHRHGIGSFRITSRFLPLVTHPVAGYDFRMLPGAAFITENLSRIGDFCRTHNLRTTFHPDQFILPCSPREEVARASLAELIWQSDILDLTGGDVINVHGGGVYGDKPSALSRLRNCLKNLPPQVLEKLTLENDECVFGPDDLIPLCKDVGIPFVYDVHHHRCMSLYKVKRALTEAEVAATTLQALSTWNREPLFHLSSPRDSWYCRDPKPHAAFVDIGDFPECWKGLDITVEIEAKWKEVAIARLAADLNR